MGDIIGGSLGFAIRCPLCNERTRVKYPGNNPENGPVRPYCTNGHSTCYGCGAWFQAIEQMSAWADPDTGQVIPAGTSESDRCELCMKQHRETHCSCGQDHDLHFHRVGGEDSQSEPYACCGGLMCCADVNE